MWWSKRARSRSRSPAKGAGGARLLRLEHLGGVAFNVERHPTLLDADILSHSSPHYEGMSQGHPPGADLLCRRGIGEPASVLPIRGAGPSAPKKDVMRNK